MPHMKYPLLARELQRWWEKQNVYRDRGQLADAANLSPNTLSRYFAGARFPRPSESESLSRLTKLNIFGSERISARFRERHFQALRSAGAKELLGLAHHHVSLMGQMGEVSRRRFYSFAFRILSAAEARGITVPAGLTPGVLVGLDLGYEPQRRFPALFFFARVLVFAKRWRAGQEREFNRLLNRWPSKHSWADEHVSAAETQPKPTRPRLVRRGLPKFSFARPQCPRCHIPLAIGSKVFSRARGEHWYFDCPKCRRRYWSNDGRTNPVNPKGSGNWKTLKDRVHCPDCKVECVVAASPSKRTKSRFWACPKCQKRYRNIGGRAVPTQPGGQERVKLSFLPNRTCPHCEKGRLSIHSRETHPGLDIVYLRCTKCDSSFRWNPGRKKLVRLRRRKGYARRQRRPGKRASLFTEAQQLHGQKHSWAQIAKRLIPDEFNADRKAAAERLRKGVKYYLKLERRTR